MDYHFVVYDPSGNVTVLVTDPVPVEEQANVAARLLSQVPDAEQVGFLSEADGCDISLRMAGGEFCGNAAMSAAAYQASRSGLTEGSVLVRVSGAPEPLPVSLITQDDGSVRGTLSMPRPLSVREELFPDGKARPVIRFPGIAHVLLEEAPDREAAEALAPQWCAHLGAEAVGLLFFDREASRMTPLVYVPDAGTLCWESACGSGTAAVGAFLAQENGAPVRVSLEQPGGTLTVTASPDGPLTLSGTVKQK